MGDIGASHFQFPAQYHKFHKDQVFNFQLNRWYSLGYARFEDMEEAGHNVTSFNSWKTEMIRLGEKAVSEKRFINAAFYLRAAEFYILTDSAEKDALYDKFRDCFDNAFGKDGIDPTHRLSSLVQCLATAIVKRRQRVCRPKTYVEAIESR